jgi:Tfp pilus assembly protein PilO
MPIVLIGISITVFFVLTNPIYNDISTLKTQVSSYNEALDNSKALENERDKLTAKFDSIDKTNLAKLQTLLPENVDNVRLILEIGQIASPYGMVLKDVKYNTTDTGTATATGAIQGTIAKPTSKNYGVFDLEFSTSGSYNNFISFTKDLESNLRIVDISSISFSSDASPASGAKANSPEVYTYNFKIKTYWLKN